MCRLFGMSGGQRRVRATFWLLEAPDSLALQSRGEPDGAGLGVFSASGKPEVHRAPIAAYEDREFAREAHEVASRTFIAHIRYASTGPAALKNTHPFEQHGRMLAHNGVVGDLPRLEGALGDYRSLVHGDTDSERVFALITREADANGGDLGAALTAAARFVAAELPLYALNLVLATPDGLWAFRYPETHDLYLVERPGGGTNGHRHFDGASAAGRMRVRSADLADAPAVVVASEPLDEHPGWRNLDPGELVYVDSELRVHTSVAVDEPPRHPLTLADLDPQAAASQHAGSAGSARPATGSGA